MIIEENMILFEPDGTLKVQKIQNGTIVQDNRLIAENVPLSSDAKIIAGNSEFSNSGITTLGFVKTGQNIQKVSKVDNPEGLILKSPDGSQWIIQVSNTGQLSAVKIV